MRRAAGAVRTVGMKPDRYRALLRVPGFPSLLAASLVGRLPVGMAGLSLVLLASQKGNYSRAGAVVAAYVGGVAVAGPVLGRLVDRAGRRRVLVSAGAGAAAWLTLLAWIPPAETATVLLAAAGAGLCTPPVSSSARSLWPAVVPERLVGTVYALEASLQELVFIVGPALVAALVALDGPRAAVLATAGVQLAGVLAFCAHPATASAAPLRPAPRAPASRRPALPVVVLAAGGLMVAAFNCTELATVAFTRHHRAGAEVGLVLAVWSAGSLAGGLLLGARAGGGRVTRARVALLMAAVAAGAAAPAVATGVAVLAALLFAGGMAIAPGMGALYSLAAGLAPAGRQTEGFGWLSSAFQVGAGAGALAGGAVVQAAGSRLGYLAGAALVGVGALAVFAVRAGPSTVQVGTNRLPPPGADQR